MTLLTAVTFGGAESVEALGFLPEEEAQLLKHRAQVLLEIPREKRIPLLVQEVKRLVTARRRQLAAADPGSLAELLSAERPAMIEVVLRALPSALADEVRQRLGARPERTSLGVSLRHELKPEVLAIIRWKLEERLAKAVPAPGSGFRFSDLLTLAQREVLAICDRMGARALATSFAGLPEAERNALFDQLPPDQKSLAQRATEAGRDRHLREEDARTVLGRYRALENPSAGMRSAGAQRLARACVAQGPDFGSKLIERNLGELGRLLAKWGSEERGRPVKGDGGRADIVEQMERLAQRGVIDRPVRLLPPPEKGLRPAGARGGALAVPPSRLGRSTALPPNPEPEEVSSLSRSALSKLRRDPIAERDARRAGAAGREEQTGLSATRRSKLTEVPETTGTSRSGLSRSAPLTAIPTRRAKPSNSKGDSRPPPLPGGKGPGRGPGSGSR